MKTVLLHLDQFPLEPATPVDALAIEHGRCATAEPMGAMNALVAQPIQRIIQGVLADRAPIATTGEEIFVIANASVASQTPLAVSTALLGGARKADLPM